MSIDDARDDDRGKGKTVRDPSQSVASASESGRCSILACVGVDNDARHEIQRRSRNLKGIEGFGEVLRPLHLRDEGEERDMSTVCEDNVRDGYQSIHERRVHADIDSALVSGDADTNHRHKHGRYKCDCW